MLTQVIDVPALLLHYLPNVRSPFNKATSPQLNVVQHAKAQTNRITSYKEKSTLKTFKLTGIIKAHLSDSKIDE